MKTINFEVSISVSRPFYSTEAEYSIDVSEKDYQAIKGASDWDDLPDEIYHRIYKKVWKYLKDELADEGSWEEDDGDPTDYYDVDITFPKIADDQTDE